MKNSRKLTIIKTVHTLIYLVMVAAIFYLLFAAITKTTNVLFYISLGLLTIESAVFVGSGMKCPLTGLAVKYGAEKGYVFDTFLPEKITKLTFRVFGTIFVIDLLFLLLNYLRLR